MARPLPYPKKVDLKEILYYYYKINPSCYALYDSEMGTAICYGSYNLVASVISTLRKDATIFYFEIDKQLGWKMKRTYTTDKKSVETQDRTKVVEKVEEKKKELT